MTSPIERAARAIREDYLSRPGISGQVVPSTEPQLHDFLAARAALASIDRDELAHVLRKHSAGGVIFAEPGIHRCLCGEALLPDSNRSTHQANAVLAWLTGEKP